MRSNRTCRTDGMLLLFLHCFLLLIIFPGKVFSQTNFSARLTGNPVNTTGWVVGDDAVVTADAIRLVKPAGSAPYGHAYTASTYRFNTCDRLTASFETRVDDFTGEPADGMSFFFLKDLPTNFQAGGGLGLPANPTGLIFAIDIYDNISGSNNPELSLGSYDGTRFKYDEGDMVPRLGQTLYKQNAVIDRTWHRFDIVYYGGKITVSLDGTEIITAPYTPPSFAGYFGFTAAIGGVASSQYIRNVQIEIKSGDISPAVTANQAFCLNATPAPLTPAGTDYKWYDAENGGTQYAGTPVPSTTATGTSSFYVAKVDAGNGCESQRAKIDVVINPLPAKPIVVSPVNYCNGATASALTATGTALKWYTSPTIPAGTATAPTPVTSLTGNSAYYVTQTDANGCESAREVLNVIVNPKPVEPSVSSPVKYCVGSTATALTATGTNLRWYADASAGTGNNIPPVPTTGTVGTTSFYVTQTDGNSCESPRKKLDVIINPLPAKPVVSIPVKYCLNSTATALTATGNNLKWYTNATTGTGSSTAPTPATGTVGTTSFYVTQTDANSCESQRQQLDVVVNALPATPNVVSPVNYCEEAVAVPLTATGSNLKWYTDAVAGTGSNTAPTPVTNIPGNKGYYVTQTDANNCESPRKALIVQVEALPATPAPFYNGAICSGDDLKLYVPATAGATYSWTGPRNSTDRDPVFTQATTTAGGVYEVRVKTANCFSRPGRLTVVVNALPVGNIIQTNTAAGTVPGVELRAPYGTGYLWNNGEKKSSIMAWNAGNYSVKVTNAQGCSNLFLTKVTLPAITIPNTFTPNADGINDYWTIPALRAFPEAKVSILNRDGQLVYETKNFIRWDGKNGGNPLPAGVYFYVVQTTPNAVPLKGWLNLVR